MKKILYLIVPLLFPIMIFSQTNSIKITGNELEPALGPILSPDGKYIAFSKSNYRGIYIYIIEDKSILELTDEIAAGFGIQWSKDSRYILSRPAYYDGMIRYNAIKIYDVISKNVKQLTDYRTKMPSMPYWSTNNDKVVIGSKGNVESFISEVEILPEFKNLQKNEVIFLMDDKIAIKNLTTNETKILDPVPGKKCMNLSVSPDNNRVVFEIYGGDLYSMKTDGTELFNLGKGFRGKWLKDSKTIVYMISEDDGHQFTYSDLYIIRFDGSNKRNISNTIDLHEMSPSASEVDDLIVFEVLNTGSINLMKIER
jgi:Tol biopolymer transport system component